MQTLLRFLFLAPAVLILPLLVALGILALLFYFLSAIFADDSAPHWRQQ
jgi:hypothetical protein